MVGVTAAAQHKYEREHRIRKSQFPEKAHRFIVEKLEGARRVRFYKETDSSKTNFEAKFKKDRLHYGIQFNEQGHLEEIVIVIRELDIPNEALANMKADLGHRFHKYRIRKILQQYPLQEKTNEDKTLRDAFQNLLLPYIRYELIVAGKEGRSPNDYEVLYDAAGNFIRIRASLPANYDHVLY
jgi:hypothetical protein